MTLDPLLLSRLQWVWVISWHILLPAFTVGLTSYIAVLEGLAFFTGCAVWSRISAFWTRIFAVSLGMGVVSGIVMLFRVGTNWNRFSDATANVLAPLLAYEGLTVFFLEASFLCVLLFGRKLVLAWLHFFSGLTVAAGTLFSTFWILSVSSWMQTPQGFHVADGRLAGITDPARFTTAMYQAAVADKPRMSGALAALEVLGVSDAAGRVAAYADRKQARLEALIAGGHVATFPDALRFVTAVSALGWPMAVASSSKNANAMLQQIRLADGRNLLGLFQANVCGRDLRHGNPDPEIFQLAAKELKAMPGQCFVVEDAPAGVEAARAGGMAALGVARLHDQAGLQAAHADMVVTSLDEVRLDALSDGRLCRTPA